MKTRGREEDRDRERKDTAENGKRETKSERMQEERTSAKARGGEKSREIQRTRNEKKVNEWTEK